MHILFVHSRGNFVIIEDTSKTNRRPKLFQDAFDGVDPDYQLTAERAIGDRDGREGTPLAVKMDIEGGARDGQKFTAGAFSFNRDNVRGIPLQNASEAHTSQAPRVKARAAHGRD